MRKLFLALIGALLLALATAGVAQPKDAKGCKDHPLFTRMPEFFIVGCKQTAFDSFKFEVASGNKSAVEGQFWEAKYFYKGSEAARPSNLQIIRNFENAIQKLGGKVVFSQTPSGGWGRTTLTLMQDKKEFWVGVHAAGSSGEYTLSIIQKDAMKQDVVANAEVFQNDIRTTGHAAVYGILFDTDKANIKLESAQAIGEVAKLLKADLGLKIVVVGHTDNSGSVEHNLKLSQERAQSVMQALIGDHGIAAARLKSYGCGTYAPVASNDSEDGKAKNRRVELVKQ